MRLDRGFAGILGEQPPPSSDAHRWYTAVVTASHDGGVFVTEVGQDEAGASKVTWGTTYRPTSPCPAGAHEHPLRRYPQGATVLVLETGDGVWIIRAAEETLT